MIPCLVWQGEAVLLVVHMGVWLIVGMEVVSPHCREFVDLGPIWFVDDCTGGVVGWSCRVVPLWHRVDLVSRCQFSVVLLPPCDAHAWVLNSGPSWMEGVVQMACGWTMGPLLGGLLCWFGQTRPDGWRQLVSSCRYWKSLGLLVGALGLPGWSDGSWRVGRGSERTYPKLRTPRRVPRL